MKFVELCAGAGGLRLGLEKSGWRAVDAIEHDEDASAIHRRVFGHCRTLDVFDPSAADLPTHSLLAAGFPCQPFSSSGHRSGFAHGSGTVFERVIEIVRANNPQMLLLENVKGLLSNQGGYTMARVLQALTREGYLVTWAVINAWWLGVPQNRPRVTMFGTRASRTEVSQDLFGEPNYLDLLRENPVLQELEREAGVTSKFVRGGSLSAEVDNRAPRVGKAASKGPYPFAAAGVAVGDYFASAELVDPVTRTFGIGKIACPQFWSQQEVKSVRYWGHSGKTRPYVNDGAMAHCIGTTIGASPMFAVPEQLVRTRKDELALLEHSNWNRTEHGLRVFRLTPSRGALLFGKDIQPIADAASTCGVSQTKLYEVIGNMVAPAVGQFCGNVLKRQLTYERLSTSDRMPAAQRAMS